MIHSAKPLSLAEAQTYIPDSEDKKALHEYIKKFSKISADKASELCEKLRKLNNPKIRDEHIVKAADFLPRDAEEVHKIFNDVSLDEKEVESILGIVGEY